MGHNPRPRWLYRGDAQGVRLSELIVAIDSQILVWGVRKQGDDTNLKRARWLFEQIEQLESQVVVPCVALSEYLVPADPSLHLGIIDALSKRFILAPFDVRCASLAAQLFVKGKTMRDMGKPDARDLPDLSEPDQMRGTKCTSSSSRVQAGDGARASVARPSGGACLHAAANAAGVR